MRKAMARTVGAALEHLASRINRGVARWRNPDRFEATKFSEKKSRGRSDAPRF
jgi:hypothetical protein